MPIDLEIQLHSIDELLRRIEKLEKKQESNTENKSKIQKVKKRTRDLLEVSTSHGIPNIVRTKSLFILIMWSFFIITSTVFCSFFVIKAILDYLKYHTITNIQVINENQAQFPTISFCAYPSLNTTLNETIISTYFDYVLETDKYYEEYHDIILGKCFRYNSGKNIYNESFEIRNSTMTGFEHGLDLSLNIKIPAEFDFVDVYLFIHNHTLPPFDPVRGHGYWLIAGSWNYFELDRIFHQKLDAPYSDCLNDVNSFRMNKTLIDYILKENKGYTQNDCLYLCSHLFALEESKCNCNSTVTYFSKYCVKQFGIDETETQKCISEYLRDFRKKDQYEKCYEYCPLECNSMNFVVNTYHGQLPINGNISNETKKDYYLSGFDSFEEMRKHFISIYVYYNDFKYTFISEEPRTELFNFISNIGGILGLFLGISFLSFIEIFEILFEIMFIFFDKKN